MKKIWKMTILLALALCLLAGCGAPAVQPERQPLVEPSVEGEVFTAPPGTPADTAQPGEQLTVDDPTKGGTVTPVEPEQTVQPQPSDTPAQPEQPAEPEVQDNPAPVPPEQAEITETKLTCTLEIRCDKLIGNADLDPDKVELIPEDGVLFAAVEVEFFEGESVFNVLQRTLKQNKQHLEFAQSPLYNSAYIEGICNLYQFDCGSLSGWMYRVNDWYPNYGCSQYVVQAGDVIVWDFTCDLGADLGVEDSTGNNQ